MEKLKQTRRVIDYIERFGSITTLEAVRDLGVMRLASRINDLRKEGYPIVSEYIKVKNRYGEHTSVKRYWIEEGDTNVQRMDCAT